MQVKQIFIALSIISIIFISLLYLFTPSILWVFLILGPIIFVGLLDIIKTEHAIRRNFPVLGNFRFLLEKIRPEIMQYFVETDTEGRPVNRLFRTLIYQRAKKVNDTTPFGTQMDVYQAG